MIMAALLLALGAGLKAEDATEAATVLSLHGKAQVLDGRKWAALEEGQPLDQGDRVRTGEGAGLQLLLADGSSLAFGPNTEATLKALGRGGKGSVTLLSLAHGLLNAMVSKLKRGSTFEVTTSNAVAAVKGTDFEVDAAKTGTKVSVAEGTVQLSGVKRKAFKAVKASQACLWDKAGFHGPFKLKADEDQALKARWAEARQRHQAQAGLLKALKAKRQGREGALLKALEERRQARLGLPAPTPEPGPDWE
jgi:hypothetical protein